MSSTNNQLFSRTVAIFIILVIMQLHQAVPIHAFTNEEVIDLLKASSTTENDNLLSDVMDKETSETIMEEFTDVPRGKWYHDDIIEAKRAGLVEGIGENKYGPELTITYAHYITTLVRVYRADVDIPEVPNKTHWSDKYIAIARELGMVDKNEKVNPDKPIPRQEMMRYTVNLLGLEPAESAEIIFADVDPKDAAYINTAYKEYLTEGNNQRTADGIKLFGFDQTSLRSEMATMVNRVAEYKKDPIAFKAERAVERAKKDAAYEAEKEKYVEFNGYKIPKEHENDRYLYTTNLGSDGHTSFSGWVIFKTRSKNFDVIEQILSSKHEPAVIKQAVDYGRTKKEGVNMYKEYKLGKQTLIVMSAPTSDRVTFDVVNR